MHTDRSLRSQSSSRPGGKGLDAAGQYPCASVLLSVFIRVLRFRLR